MVGVSILWIILTGASEALRNVFPAAEVLRSHYIAIRAIKESLKV